MKKASDSAKDLARKKAKRTDAAGRTGMGESSSSNTSYKDYAGPGSGKMYKPSLSTARNTYGGDNYSDTREGINSAFAAERYRNERKQSMNPRRDNSGYGNAGFGKNK
jgi:hypothetical protein